MSWVQHKNHPTTTSPSSSLSATASTKSPNTYSSPSSILLNSTLSSANFNNSYNTTNRNANSLRQASQPLTNTAPTSSMTSQNPNKGSTLLKSPTKMAMRLNPAANFQSLTQQHLLQQQPIISQHQQQQQQPHPHQLNNALQQPTSQVPPQTATTSSSTLHLQGVAISNSQQHNSWQTLQQEYLPSTKMMQPMPPTVAAQVPGVPNSWSSQPPQQNFQNNDMYQQSAVPQQQQQLQQPQQQQPQQQWQSNPPPNPTYDNYYHQQSNNNMYQQQPPAAAQQQFVQQNAGTYFQQQPPQATQIQSNPANLFDQSFNNNQTSGADGWSDWDWNDNSTALTQATAEDQPPSKAETTPLAAQQLQPVDQIQTSYNNSLLSDSFNTKNNNDSWSWGSKQNDQQVSNKESTKLDNPTLNNNYNWNNQTNGNEKEQYQFSAQLPLANESNNESWNYQATNENQQHVTSGQNLSEVSTMTVKHGQIDSSPQAPPPPMEFSSSASENHNYNTNTTTTPPNNIPNTVFVTQAKPVTLPSRQYASPPGGNTPIAENPPETPLMPPQGFQNETIASPPEVAAPPLINAAPPSGIPTTLANKSANPFKRSGVAQHHRATGLIATTSAPSATTQASEPPVFNMPPPPPADFANNTAVTLTEPDNNELPSQENQQVFAPPSTQIPLQSAAIQTAATIPLSNSSAFQAPPPPNDERNQYLQTSHLSENSEEQQPEIDGLLPPPGLSRLVLGEPELEASQQRMVMGTEASNTDNAITQAAVMHLEERHADGEDTASENAAPVTVSVIQGVPANSSSTLTSNRNLYMVPGESNTANSNQQQRVVTGVELAEQREIEMDGENLEDEPIHQQQQHHHPPPALSVESRNEPPVEGADDTVIAPPPATTLSNTIHLTDQHQDNQHHHSTNQVAKIKDSHPISSPNDDDNSDERLLNDRGVNQSTGGSSKSRTKYENERLAAASRRRDKRTSAERYESDEYLNSEGEYSSEREERVRRERDRRRNYREGSVRSDRGGNDEDDKHSRRQRAANKRDKYYYEGEERNRGGRDERERERDRGLERSKTERRSQRQRGYEADSRYETEESTRFDSRKDLLRRSTRRSDRADHGPDYDEYNRRGAYRSSKRPVDNYESDRRDRRRSDKQREPRYREDPRYDPREYEDYRKHSSRNARESDVEKEGAAPLRSGRIHQDPRHAGAMYGYPSSGYYDPYTAYYYQQMARTNPQAYAEWYKKYYGQAAGTAAQTGSERGAPNADTSLPASGNDGRESVHSGRSSAHNDIKDRYTHAYITQANDYHRHYQQQQHLHQQHFHQQQQQMAFNHSLNSTMLDEENLNHNTTSMFTAGLASLSLARSNTNLSQIHGSFYMPATTCSTATGLYYARSDYAESRSGAVSVRDPDSIAQEAQRLTPCKFITEHTVVNFASGILVTVKPKYTPHGSNSNIVKLLKFKPNDETRKLFKVFPGPLVRGLTHKKTVIEFCQEQIRLGPMETTIYAKQLITNNAEKYRGSYTLMWNLLILLLKQNGMVVGTDIAELLLKNQQQFPYQTPVSTANNSLKSKSGSNSPTEDLNSNKDGNELADALNKSVNLEQESAAEVPEKLQEEEDLEDSSLAKSSSNSITLSEGEVTEKFRNYLLYGNVNEALEWATDNNLWGHALFLASKLDRRSHANVMMKFANKLSLNDPLQTLYQLMSGRSPSSVTCVQDEKWGDWRPHLSMILSNTSQKPELDRKAITTLGDSLFNRGDLYAAHFCYLMAQVGFGRYQESVTQETSLQQHLPKLVLLGSSHYKQFKDFAHNEAIIMTEIYEYACSLNDDKFSIIEFQPYKFLLATRLLDYGFHLKSLMYLEQIAVHISRDPSKYENSFIHKVYEMADRLKYYDPVLEKTIEDQQPGSDENAAVNLTTQQMEEQKWLQNLRQLAQQYKNDFNATPAVVLQSNQQPQIQDPGYYNQQQQIDQQFMEINKQFSELNLQYQQTAANNEQQLQQPPMFYNPEQQQQQHLQEQPPVDPYHQIEPQQTLATELHNQNATDIQQPVESLQNVYQQHPQYMQPEMTQQSPGYSSNYYDPSQYNTVEAAANNLDNQQAATYDYWPQQQQQLGQPAEENARPTISMPKSKTYDTDDENTKRLQQQTGNENNKKQQQQTQQKGAKKEDLNKNLQQSNQNSGWFGGIWNKFSLKPKNQMILPDDKNPAIVWDAEKKKWINTDGDEDEQEAVKPPPKMSDLVPQQQIPTQTQSLPQQQQQPQTNQIPFMDLHQMQHQQPQLQQYAPINSVSQSAPSPNPVQQQQNLNPNQPQAPAPAKTPTLQSNMFKMQRNRTLKNAYVDVFNPSGAPVNKEAENILAPALPPAAVPQGGFFIPGTAPGAGSIEEQQYQQQQQQQQQPQLQQQDAPPQFYNPNQFTRGTGY